MSNASGNEFEKYIEDFIEKPSPAFGGLPICPFAKAARVNEEISYVITDESSILEEFSKHIQSKRKVLIVILLGTSLERINELSKRYSSEVKDLGWTVFGGHPEDKFEIGGIRTRCDLVPNIQFIQLAELEKARKTLPPEYYSNFTEDVWKGINLQDVS